VTAKLRVVVGLVSRKYVHVVKMTALFVALFQE